MLDTQPKGPAIAQARPRRTNVVWRFYVDPEGGWRWQQLTSDQSVLADSTGAHPTYDDCVRDAESQGYRFYEWQEKFIDRSRTNKDGGWG